MTALPITAALPLVGAGLIPIVGLIAVGYIIIRAVRNHDEEDEDEPDSPPT
jgi:hypothetical protein